MRRAILGVILCTEAAVAFAPSPTALLAYRSPFQCKNRCTLGLRGGGGSGATGSSMIFDGIFGSKEPKGEPTGKFVQHAKLEGVAGAFGPPGIIIGGLGEDELEVLGDAVERVLAGADGKPVVNVPFLVLGKDEVGEETRLRDLLKIIDQRDCEIPDEVATMKVPLVLISGLTPVQVSGCVKAIVGSGIKGGVPGAEAAPMCAIAVPKALDKSMAQLIDELCGDHMANAPP